MCEETMHIFSCGCKAPSYKRCRSAVVNNVAATECPFLGDDDDKLVSRICMNCYIQQRRAEEADSAATLTGLQGTTVLGTRALQNQCICPDEERIFGNRGRQRLGIGATTQPRRSMTDTELPEYDERMKRRILQATIVMQRNMSAPFESRAPDCRPPSQIHARKKTIGRKISEHMKALIAKFAKDKKEG
ncbi:hypothetical protein EYC84_002469 [Monilinia fructicola]|uniref:Uncharacterized protein n=1 Tax=Monilinia fructicola TaxID=38448 RepID=A0A5M9JQ40_MONFR|nr:hypothetical protein EYC84_002469 [Monilinia fructicola]